MIIAVAILIVVLVLSGALTSCSALGSGINSGTVATSFTAEDDDIRQVEADYVALETVLQNKVDSIETDHQDMTNTIIHFQRYPTILLNWRHC